MSSHRKERVADTILAFVGEKLRRMNDPRLEFLTLTSVVMSADLRSARIFWTLLGNQASLTVEASAPREVNFPEDTEIKQSAAALQGVRSHLRHDIGKELGLRYTPQLIFEYDKSLEKGFHIDRLLDKIRKD